MHREQLQFNNLSAEAFAWLQATHTAIDSMNVNDFGRMLADEAELMSYCPRENPIIGWHSSILAHH